MRGLTVPAAGSCWPGPSRPRTRNRIRPGARRRAAAALAACLLLTAGCASAPSPAGRPETAPALAEGVWWPSPAPADRWFPASALLLPNGVLAVAETARNRIFLIDGTERPPFRAPSPGREPVEWTALSAAPGLSFYALDGPGRAVHQYDLQGNYLGLALDLDRVAAEQGLGPVDPAGLAVDRAGQAVISDRSGDRLLVFGPGWNFLGVWGQSGSQPGSWRRPGRVAVGDRPPFLVADEGNRRVVLLDELGAVRGVRDLDGDPKGVGALEDGGFALTVGAEALVLDGSLFTRERYALPSGPGCTRTPYATAAVAGDADVLFVGDGCSGRLFAFRRSGT